MTQRPTRSGPPDVIVVGAGPAGLTTAAYLGRFRREVVVLDGGGPRAELIPESHNTPGFPGGVSGPELLARMRAQATIYGAELRGGRVRRIRKTADGFGIETEDGQLRSRFVVLATGVVDRRPPIPGVDEAIRRGLVRVCPVCDAYEAQRERIAVLGERDLGAREALFLRTYSKDVTLLQLGAPPSQAQREALGRAGVSVLEASTDQLRLDCKGVALTGPRPASFEVLYLALGCERTHDPEISPAPGRDEDGLLVVDPVQETTVDGLYAAGDAVRGLNQIAVAVGEAAIAAARIHRRLREQEGQTLQGTTL